MRRKSCRFKSVGRASIESILSFKTPRVRKASWISPEMSPSPDYIDYCFILHTQCHPFTIDHLKQLGLIKFIIAKNVYLQEFVRVNEDQFWMFWLTCIDQKQTLGCQHPIAADEFERNGYSIFE